MEEQFTSIPVIESNLYLFGGLQRTVSGEWTLSEQTHRAFEVIGVLEGSQAIEIKGVATYVCHPGDVMIVAPGMTHALHNNDRSEPMSYVTFRFNSGSLDLRMSINKLTNQVFSRETTVAQLAISTVQQMLRDSRAVHLSRERLKVKLQMSLLNFLDGLMANFESKQLTDDQFSDREIEISRQIATAIEEKIEQGKIPEFSFGEICEALGISSGYGHRTFKKVYGVTPLHFIEEQKYRKARALLGSPEFSIEKVATIMGASSVSNFSKQFKKWSGLTPSKYQRQVIKRLSNK
ncbi:AraC family transcriptional regulator [Secundilactobacillus odoratitofui]|nr:helix-turn-helix domain-containing protein [Secundilactobacillus odoratitofui]